MHALFSFCFPILAGIFDKQGTVSTTQSFLTANTEIAFIIFLMRTLYHIYADWKMTKPS